MKDFLNSSFGSTISSIVGKLILAIIVLIIGNILIKIIIRKLPRFKKFARQDKTVQTFIISFIKIALYIVLIIFVISILGIPMASIVAVLASAGLAIGLALQGALSNCAGGIMILIFKPFRVDDYISCSGGEGIVREISLFYTKVLTLDNKKVTIPNSTLMSDSVTNFSSEEYRRVDLSFAVASDSDIATVEKILIQAANANDKVVSRPEPFARLVKVEDNAANYTLRAWCKSADYWDVYFDLTSSVMQAFGAFGISTPASKLEVNLNK